MRAEAPERTGWPWRASVRLPRVTAALPVGDRTLRWGAERVDLTIAPSDAGALLVSPAGAQTLQWGDAEPIAFSAALATLRVRW